MRTFELILLAIFTSVAGADALFVGAGGYSSIQSAINDAYAGDTIIVKPGTYYENINFLGKAVTVCSQNPDDPNIVGATIIDGSQPGNPHNASAVTFNSGESNASVLTGFTITGGSGTWVAIAWRYYEVFWNRCGGGVVCYNLSEPTIAKNRIIENLAGEGGGIYVYGNPVNPANPSNPPVHIKPVISGNLIENNSAIVNHGFSPPDSIYPVHNHGDGGALVCFQGVDAVITDNTIRNNHADFYGGAIHLRQWSNGIIQNNLIKANDSALGAGVHITYNAAPVIRANRIEANTAGGLGGGGIYVYYQSTPLIEKNLITQNTSSNGAGIGVYYSSDAVIRDNVIVKNLTGAGILVTGDATAQITGNTIADNTPSAVNGGGIEIVTGQAVVIENNIIASNGKAHGIYTLSAIPVIGFNNVWNNAGGNYSTNIPDQTGLNGNISANPRFITPESSSYAISYDSPCINAGNPAYTPAPGQTDYNGDGRLMGQYVDIGADEVPPVWNIIKNQTSMNIQQALDSADNFDVIVVTVGVHTGNGNRDIDFKGKSLTLQSINPEDRQIVAATIIDCQGSMSQPHRGFYFHSGETHDAVVDGLTITNGSGAYNGGAINCTSSSPTIRNCILIKNLGKDHGGAIYCGDNANPLITGCTLTENSFNAYGYGGAIYCYKSSPTITNCIITKNNALGTARHGGGICCWGDQDATSSPVVANCIVSGNSAGQRGGGLYAYWSNPIFINCTVIGNLASQGGGVGSFRQADPKLINCIVRDNRAEFGNQLALINTISVWPGVNLPTWMTVSYSDIEGGFEQAYIQPNCTLYWQQGNIDADPNFVNQGFWQYPDANPIAPEKDFFIPGNYHLLPASACVDKGSNAAVPAEITIDIDGEARIYNSLVDMGADELVLNPADFNTDGIVDPADLEMLISEWLLDVENSQIDISPNDFIDIADFALFAESWLWKAAWRIQ